MKYRRDRGRDSASSLVPPSHVFHPSLCLSSREPFSPRGISLPSFRVLKTLLFLSVKDEHHRYCEYLSHRPTINRGPPCVHLRAMGNQRNIMTSFNRPLCQSDFYPKTQIGSDCLILSDAIPTTPGRVATNRDHLRDALNLLCENPKHFATNIPFSETLTATFN